MRYESDDDELDVVKDEIDYDFRGRGLDVFNSEDEDEYDQNGEITDTTSAQARKGKDIQGIHWNMLSTTRNNYRQARLKQYRNYENIPNSGEASEKECNPSKKGGMYYEFLRNTRSVKSTFLHFQLRNLVWATTKHDVYLMSQSHYSIVHWSAMNREKSEVLNLSGHIVPCEKHPGSLLEGFCQTQVSTLAVKDNLLVAGGFQGELICKCLDRVGVSYCYRVTCDENAITNSVEIYDCPSGAPHFMASSNDWGIRNFNMKTFQLCRHFRFDWPVNHSSIAPDRKLVVVVGDNTEGLLVDADTGKVIQELRGHHDYSFASAWNPDGVTFATGNQDKTCRVWDIRNLSKSLVVLRGNLGAIRSIRFSSDGRFMAMAEPADFVHIFDVGKGYKQRQEVDFFGEISGISLSPDAEALFVGVWDRTYASLLQYRRRWNYSYYESDLI